MTRRVIYIKNPSSGSHFRTINGNPQGPQAPRPPRAPRQPKAPKPGDYVPWSWSSPAPSDWATGGWNDIPGVQLPFGTNPGYYYGAPGQQHGGVIGPYDMSYLLPPERDAYMTRPLEWWEKVIALSVMGGVVYGSLPALTAAAATGEGGLAGLTYGPAAVMQYGGQAGWISVTAIAGADEVVKQKGGQPIMFVNDAPKTVWDRASGRYVLQYPDLLKSNKIISDIKKKKKKKR